MTARNLFSVQSQVKFNRVPKQVPEKVPGGFGAEESLRGFGAEPGQVQQGSGEGLGLGGFGAEPDQVEQGSGEGSREGSGFGAEPCQVQQGSGKGSGEGSGKPCCKAKLGSTGSEEKVPEKIPEKVWEALVQPGQVQQGFGEGLGGFGAEPGQVQQGSEKVSEKVWEALVRSPVGFNRVPEKVLEKVPEKALGGFGAEPGQVQQGSGEGSGEGLGGSGAESGQVQQDLWAFNSQKPSLGVWLRTACFRKICKNKVLRLLGIPPKLITKKSGELQATCLVRVL